MPFVSSVRGNFGLAKRPFPDFIPTTANSAITGGTITTAGGYRIHTFTTVGSSTFDTTPNESRNGTNFKFPLEILVVGGGGAAGSRHGGGGGAGGMIIGTNVPGKVGSTSIAVGGGGASQFGDVIGNKGTNSTFDTNIIALGGGGGGNWTDNNSAVTTGGSGGGGSSGNGAVGGVAQQASSSTYSGVTLTGYGYNGGDCRYTSSINAGGGGGAGAAGANGTAGVGNGGAGRQNSILGTNYFWAGGGGGGTWEGATGGNGGSGGGGGGAGGPSGSGGTGGLNNGVTPPNYGAQATGTVGGNAGANTGSGGGGCNQSSSTSGAGGSGIVVIRYPI